MRYVILIVPPGHCVGWAVVQERHERCAKLEKKSIQQGERENKTRVKNSEKWVLIHDLARHEDLE